MSEPGVILITGARKGIGRGLVDHYLAAGWTVVGCSRGPGVLESERYRHHQVDVADESAVRAMLDHVSRDPGRLDAVVNNAGVAAMNPALLTPLQSVEKILATNVAGTFLVVRESARLLRRSPHPRIVNLSTVAVPFRLEGEAMYAASKSAVETLTRILARELAAFRITVNAVGPTPVETDLIRGVPPDKLQTLVSRQAIPRMGTLADVANVIDFFLRPESDFITGQVIYLGGAS